MSHRRKINILYNELETIEERLAQSRKATNDLEMSKRVIKKVDAFLQEAHRNGVPQKEQPFEPLEIENDWGDSRKQMAMLLNRIGNKVAN